MGYREFFTEKIINYREIRETSLLESVQDLNFRLSNQTKNLCSPIFFISKIKIINRANNIWTDFRKFFKNHSYQNGNDKSSDHTFKIKFVLSLVALFIILVGYMKRIKIQF